MAVFLLAWLPRIDMTSLEPEAKSPIKSSKADTDRASRAEAILGRESGLRRKLTSSQVSMIALGGAIGTGLFLGSAIPVRAAGPGVILSYGTGALITVLLMWALAEMAVAHPVAGSFGVYAEIYLHPWAGFVMRYSYWLAQVVAIGSEVVAASIYCRYWYPGVPGWIWIVGFSVSLVYVNARSVANFGAFEYWFAMIKVVTIVLFLILGAALILGVGFPRIGFSNYTGHGGFLPHGWVGVGLGVAMAIFSYLGTEIVAVTAGEADDPTHAVPRALRQTLARLALFYIGGIAVLVGVLPWDKVGPDGISICERVPGGGDTRCRGGDEFCGADGSAFERQLQFVFNFADDFFAVARRLRAANIWTAEQAGRAAGGVVGIQRGDVCGAGAEPLLQRDHLCVHDRRSVFRRAVCVDDDIRDAPDVPAARAPRLFAIRARRALEFSRWACGADGRDGVHVVGARIPHHVEGRAALACVHLVVLLCVGKATGR